MPSFIPMQLPPLDNDFGNGRRKLMRRDEPLCQFLRLGCGQLGRQILPQGLNEDGIDILVLPVTRPQGSQ